MLSVAGKIQQTEALDLHATAEQKELDALSQICHNCASHQLNFQFNVDFVGTVPQMQ